MSERRVKFVSDGNPYNMRLVDAQTGETIKGVTKVEMVLTPAELPEMVVHYVDFLVDIDTEAWRVRWEKVHLEKNHGQHLADAETDTSDAPQAEPESADCAADTDLE